MYKRQQNKRNRPYRVKKTGIKDENIDRQILVLHRAIGFKMLAYHERGDNSLTELVQATLDSRRDEGRIGYGEYLTWSSVLELLDNKDDFLAGLLEDDGRMRKLRRRTPFVGVLTEEERQTALDKDAIGELTDLGTLF